MEILDTYTQWTDSTTLIFILLMCCFLICGIFSAVELDLGNGKRGCVLGCFALIFLLAVIIAIYNKTEYIYHKVHISNLNNLDTDKYKIVEQKGKIITIKEVK